MAELAIPPGIFFDDPAAGGNPRWQDGLNVRFRPLPETIGLTALLVDAAGDLLDLYDGAAHVGTSFIQAKTVTPILGARDNAITVFAGPGHMKAVDTNDAAAPAAGEAVYRQQAILPSTGYLTPSLDIFHAYAGLTIAPFWSIAAAPNAMFAVQASEDVLNPVFIWDGYSPVTSLAPLAGSPTGAVACVLTDDQHLLLLGSASVGGGAPLMTVRWASRGAPTDWTPTDVNSSGEFQLTAGTKIMGGGSTGQGILCWTDRAFYLINQLQDGASYFGPRLIDKSAGLLGTAAWAEADGVVYWLGSDLIFRMWSGGGAPQEIPCPIRGNTVEAMDAASFPMVQAYTNAEYDEVGWMMPDENGQYAILAVYNYSLNLWTIHCPCEQMIARTDRVGGSPQMLMRANGYIGMTDLMPPRTDVTTTGPLSPYPIKGVPTNLTALPREWWIRSSRFAPVETREQSQSIRKILQPATTRGTPGAAEGFAITLTGYEEQTGAVFAVSDIWTTDTLRGEPRVEGRVFSVEIGNDPAVSAGDSIVRRFGHMDLSFSAGRGQR